VTAGEGYRIPVYLFVEELVIIKWGFEVILLTAFEADEELGTF
jgi:hypothetical protein